MAAAGYAGTELGDWGFLPTAPAALAADVRTRNLALVGAFVPVAPMHSRTVWRALFARRVCWLKPARWGRLGGWVR